MSLIEVKLRPSGPWRVGDRAGDRERVDVVYHSDALFSAVTHAMGALGWLEEWLDATARAAGEPAVRFSSLFPFVGKTRLVAPPKSVWPPATPGKLYLQAAKLIPLEIVKNGVVEESRWQVDGESGCLLPMGVAAPFRVSLRAAAAVDRFTGATEPHRTACLEFAPNAGWWGVFEVSDPAWEARVKSALRLLADSGFGGERSRGWGRSGEPQFSEAAHLFAAGTPESLRWLLSLYSPHESDAVDWARGEYAAVVRGGWTDSAAGAGAKKQVRMMAEGSVVAAETLRGQAVDVAPDGFPHPVYRAGFALSMPAPSEIAVRAVESTKPVKPVVSPAAAVAEPIGTEPTVAELEEAATLPNPEPVEPEPVTEPMVETSDATESIPEPDQVATLPDPEPLEPEPVAEHAAETSDATESTSESEPTAIESAEPEPQPASSTEPESSPIPEPPSPEPESQPEPAKPEEAAE